MPRRRRGAPRATRDEARAARVGRGRGRPARARAAALRQALHWADALTESQQTAIAAVDKGDDAAARTILFGDEYGRELDRIAAQVGSGLMHCHSLNVVHRDVKPGNVIFVDSSHSAVRLVDFGFAAFVDGNRRLRTMCGSPAYMAPELVLGRPYLGPPVDVWALGALVYELLHNKPAFRGESMTAVRARPSRAPRVPPPARSAPRSPA